MLNVALMKRPRRTPNAEAIFLDSVWGQLDQALRDGDPTQIREAFLVQRTACMSCHTAEGYGFLNEMPLFRNTASFPDN